MAPGRRLLRWDVLERTARRRRVASGAARLGSSTPCVRAVPVPPPARVPGTGGRQEHRARACPRADGGRRGAGLVRVSSLPAHSGCARHSADDSPRPPRAPEQRLDAADRGDGALRARAAPARRHDWDDEFSELDDPARFVLRGGGSEISLTFLRGYPFAHVFAPADGDFVCFEPMTAPHQRARDGRGPLRRRARRPVRGGLRDRGRLTPRQRLSRARS